MSESLRPPIVTILGHVDHGKTSLLDFIRKASVASGEHGGITQAIGAYQTTHQDQIITFIDTPGHAAFEKMRSRGAKVADIAVLVVAVDDGVMPQTVEAIKHIKLADVPMIVAVNKVDLPGINVKVQLEKIKKSLSDNGVLVEEYGGDTPIVALSAKTGAGVDDLLETISLVAQIHEFKGDPEALLQAVVIESHLDKFKGALATVLVRNGSLKKGDSINVGGVACKVRGMFDWNGKPVDKALPSTPVEVLGWSQVPPVGGETGQESRVKESDWKVQSLVDKLKTEGTNTLNVIVKADKEGSLEAIEEALYKFNDKGEHLKIITSGTGEIGDSDIELAGATKAIVLGFNVLVKPTANKLAETNHTLIRSYTIIYELIDEIKDVVDGMLIPGVVEEVFGRAQIIAEFQYGKDQKIAGCRVLEGGFSKGPKVRVVRGQDEVVGESKIRSLKKAREEVNRVEMGNECGMLFDPVIEFKVGDIVESFRTL